ncbi:membrane metalloprotease [Sinomicrobium pectinilyticum]|uniref:Membrane metalloprotease n=1 Tax=Sinomicrobium pectinilyticum TaxID=1084421 RepID=A0A3N0DPI2_SINP1|nr:membrane metalloprotease [Sinomicrobium pectinilyticum]RNL77356.1 membrane metalloprotease [Sinomicrobium pectinilyticum]
MSAKRILWGLLLLVIVSAGIISCSGDDGNEGMVPKETEKALNREQPGDAAHDLLSAQNYSRIVLEFIYIEGYEPSSQSVENLKSFIEARMHKPGGIVIEERWIDSPGLSEYSVDAVFELEKEERMRYTDKEDGEITVFAFFADKGSDKNEGNQVVLGAAYLNTSFVIYESTIREISGRTGAPSRVTMESTVLQHEFGHLLGLVDLGTEMQEDHLDEANGHHCDVEECLMFHQAESGGNISDLISGGEIPGLDAQCLADLRANGGK